MFAKPVPETGREPCLSGRNAIGSPKRHFEARSREKTGEIWKIPACAGISSRESGKNFLLPAGADRLPFAVFWLTVKIMSTAGRKKLTAGESLAIACRPNL
ncbi:MAG: hypothetical protein HZA50_10805 [Planctomycetes bacterium]|nr:hypothetical protein [Planctomycetota bacterium]